MIFINSEVQLIKTDYTRPCYISVKNNKQTKKFPKFPKVKKLLFFGMTFNFVLDAHSQTDHRPQTRPRTILITGKKVDLTIDLTTTTIKLLLLLFTTTTTVLNYYYYY